MKSALKISLPLVFITVLLADCNKNEVLPIIEPDFKTTCLLTSSKTFDSNGRVLQENKYEYDTQRRLIKSSWRYNISDSTIRYEIFWEDIYEYDTNGFLINNQRKGFWYNGYVLQNNLNPNAEIIGNTKYKYEGNRLVEENKYIKITSSFVMEFANPRIEIRKFEYDSQGNVVKYSLENPDEPTKIYELANGKVVRATDKYFWVDIAQEVSSQGLVTFRKFPSGPSNKDDIYIKTWYEYDDRGRLLKRKDDYTDPQVTKISWEYAYEDTPTPESTLPLLKGYPKQYYPEGSNQYNITREALFYLYANEKDYKKDFGRTFLYSYNIEKLPLSRTEKGQLNNEVGQTKYEYVGCQ